MKNILVNIRKNIYGVIFAASIAVLLNTIIDLTNLSTMDEAFIEASDTLDAYGPIGIIFLTIIFAPIVEELIFRKLVFKLLRKRLNFIISALISSIAFGIVHLNITQFIYAFLLGLVLAYGYEITGSIFMPIFMHAISNISVILLSGSINISTSLTEKVFIILILIVIAILSVYRLHQVNNISFLDIVKRK